MMEVHVFERYSEVEEDGSGRGREDSGWQPRTTLEGPLDRVMNRMRVILNEQFPLVPDKLLFVEAGDLAPCVTEVDVKPVGVQLVKV